MRQTFRQRVRDKFRMHIDKITGESSSLFKGGSVGRERDSW